LLNERRPALCFVAPRTHIPTSVTRHQIKGTIAKTISDKDAPAEGKGEGDAQTEEGAQAGQPGDPGEDPHRGAAGARRFGGLSGAVRLLEDPPRGLGLM